MGFARVRGLLSGNPKVSLLILCGSNGFSESQYLASGVLVGGGMTVGVKVWVKVGVGVGVAVAVAVGV